jgi:hypothetical protein
MNYPGGALDELDDSQGMLFGATEVEEIMERINPEPAEEKKCQGRHPVTGYFCRMTILPR